MDLALSLEWAGIEAELPPLEHTYNSSVAATLPTSLLLREDSQYQLTHAMMFRWGFGLRESHELHTDEIRQLDQLTAELIIRNLYAAHWDLVSEFLICRLAILGVVDDVSRVAFASLKSAQTIEGGIPGPEAALRLNARPDTRLSFEHCYHTTLTTIIGSCLASAIARNEPQGRRTLPTLHSDPTDRVVTHEDIRRRHQTRRSSEQTEIDRFFLRARSWLMTELGSSHSQSSLSAFMCETAIRIIEESCDVSHMSQVPTHLPTEVDVRQQTRDIALSLDRLCDIELFILGLKKLQPSSAGECLQWLRQLDERWAEAGIVTERLFLTSPMRALHRRGDETLIESLARPPIELDARVMARALLPPGDFDALVGLLGHLCAEPVDRSVAEWADGYDPVVEAAAAFFLLSIYDLVRGLGVARCLLRLSDSQDHFRTEIVTFLLTHQTPEGAIGYMGPEQYRLGGRMGNRTEWWWGQARPTVHAVWTMALASGRFSS